MRFDLEIPATNNVDFTFIREGYDFPSLVTPIIYHKNNNIDLFPSDFISSEVGYFPKEFLLGGYETVSGPEIRNPKSDTFILTDIIKYSPIDGSDIPLFYKHIISESVPSESIKVVDFFGATIDKSQYLVDTQKHLTNIYINKQNKTLFVEYVSNNSAKKVTLNLRPIYEEESWINILTGNIDSKKYIFRDNIISVNHDGNLFIAYLSDTKLFRPPYGNLEDPWYPGILNASFSIIKNGKDYKYWVPEYYLQDLDTDYRYKLVKNKKCHKLLDNYIQTEYPIGINALDSIYVYVYDYYSKNIKYAFTSKKELDGSLYANDIYYSYVSDISYDGIIALPVMLTDNDIAYATFYTDEYYFEYKGIDLKTAFNNGIDYVILYLKPNVLDTQASVCHALIGDSSLNIGAYSTIDDFVTHADLMNYYTVAIISSINPYSENSNSEFIELRCQGNQILDKYKACSSDIDVLYKDIINNEIVFPTNDTLVAVVNVAKLVNEGKLSYTNFDNNIQFDAYSLNYFDKINEILLKNLDASTYPIIELDL